MLLRPAVFPFLRVRGILPTQSRRSGLFTAKTRARGHSAAAGKGRRFTA